MKKEIDVALNLLSSYVQRYGSIKEEVIRQFRTQLEKLLIKRYEGHWYPDKPIKGQAFRSLEFNKENGYCDITVAQVCRNLGFTPNLLGIRHELILWIDPYEVSIRLGNSIYQQNNQQLIVARFNKEGNEIIHNDLDALLSQTRVPMINTVEDSPKNSSSFNSISSTDSSSISEHKSSPSYFIKPQSMYHNDPLYTPSRVLSPQAPVFQMSSSTPINVPLQSDSLENTFHNIDEDLFTDSNNDQPDRSDTPQSMNSTTSNESTDSGYCGYVESYPYYYKLNRLYKALAVQRFATNSHSTRKIPHSRHIPYHIYQQQQQQQQQQNNAPSYFSTSPPTPTPLNIDQLGRFYGEQRHYPISTAPNNYRKFK